MVTGEDAIIGGVVTKELSNIKVFVSVSMYICAELQRYICIHDESYSPCSVCKQIVVCTRQLGDQLYGWL